jgi:hypothetical protein
MLAHRSTGKTGPVSTYQRASTPRSSTLTRPSSSSRNRKTTDRSLPTWPTLLYTTLYTCRTPGSTGTREPTLRVGMP